MAIYKKIKNHDNLFVKDGDNTLYTSINGEMKEVNLVPEGKVFERAMDELKAGRSDNLPFSTLFSEGMVKAIVVALLTILFTFIAVTVVAQPRDSYSYTGGVVPDYIDVQNGSDIVCGEVFLFQAETGGTYNFDIRNVGCDEFGNSPDTLTVDIYTLFVPDGLRVYGEFGNLITGNIAVPNDGFYTINGFTMANGPLIVDGVNSYTPLQNFPPVNWMLPTDNPFGCMRTPIPVQGEYNVTIELTAFPDAYTVFWVYVHCPEGDYEHPVVVEYEELCSNIGDILDSDTTFIYGQCADTVRIKAPIYQESPIADTVMDICIGDEAFLSPFVDFGLDGTVEWLDADLLPFKTFPVYGDTSITFIHYDTSGCLFQNTYYIQAFTDVGLSIDTLEVLRGDYITYRPDLEIYGFDVDYPLNSNMDTDDGNLFYHTADNDILLYFEYDVNGFGCYENGILYLNVIDANVYFPNVFNPNSNVVDNITFRPIFGKSSDAVFYTLAIYDRWGSLLYSADDGVWDGTFAGDECDPGVYVWVSTVLLSDGRLLDFKGDVTLIR